MITKEHAEALFDRIREGFSNLESLITEAIELRAWEPLGYTTFAEAWQDRLKGIPLATDALKVHVIYALINDGRSDADIVRDLDGAVGDAAVANVRTQRERGIPAGPLVRVRSFDRALPSQPDTLRIKLTPTKLARLKELTGGGRLMEVEASRAIDALIRRLEKSRAVAS